VWVVTAIVIIIYFHIIWDPTKCTSHVTSKGGLKRNMSAITMAVHWMYRIVTKEVFPLMNAPPKAKVLFKVVLPSWRVA
jgi:hypothetical protein